MKKIAVLLMMITVAGAALASVKSVTLSIKGWTCGSCAISTRAALKKLDGVKDVHTDHEKMEAVVTYDDSKVTPEKMIQVAEKLGYTATVKAEASVAPATVSALSEKRAPEDATSIPERVTFFEVPLGCSAAEGLGCGSMAKPILRQLEQEHRIAEARINYPGTRLAVVWKDPRRFRSGISVVERVFKKSDLDVTALRGSAREEALAEYQPEHWYRAADVDRLSEREADVIASRLVGRVKDSLGLAPDVVAALTHDLSLVLARHLTRDSPTGRDVVEQELTKVASKYLDPSQLAELRKAGELGVRALPGESN